MRIISRSLKTVPVLVTSSKYCAPLLATGVIAAEALPGFCASIVALQQQPFQIQPAMCRLSRVLTKWIHQTLLRRWQAMCKGQRIIESQRGAILEN